VNLAKSDFLGAANPTFQNSLTTRLGKPRPPRMRRMGAGPFRETRTSQDLKFLTKKS
jgi:hypothetical protein